TWHQFLVLCYDLDTGKERWRKVVAEQVPHEGHHETHSFAASSPMTDGKRLWVHFGSRGVHCLDLDGKLLWSKDLGRMNTRYGWGEAVSPALAGDVLIVNWDQEEGSFITGLEASTGKEIWRKDRDEPTTWATPLVVERGGKTQVVVSGTNKIRSYE